MSKSTAAAFNCRVYECNFTLPRWLAQSEHHNRVNFESFPCYLVSLFFVFLKLIKNRNAFGNNFYTKKLRIVNIFPTQYHLLRFDKRFESNFKNTVRRTWKSRKQNSRFFKLLLFRDELRKLTRDSQDAVFPYLSNGVSFASIRQTVWKWRPKQYENEENTRKSVFRIFKITLQP